MNAKLQPPSRAPEPRPPRAWRQRGAAHRGHVVETAEMNIAGRERLAHHRIAETPSFNLPGGLHQRNEHLTKLSTFA